MKLNRDMLIGMNVIEESGSGTKALKIAGEGSKETQELIKATAEERNEEGAKMQDEVSVNPEADDRKKEEKKFEKTQEKEQEKMYDSQIEENIFDSGVHSKIGSLVEEAVHKGSPLFDKSKASNNRAIRQNRSALARQKLAARQLGRFAINSGMSSKLKATKLPTSNKNKAWHINNANRDIAWGQQHANQAKNGSLEANAEKAYSLIKRNPKAMSALKGAGDPVTGAPAKFLGLNYGGDVISSQPEAYKGTYTYKDGGYIMPPSSDKGIGHSLNKIKQSLSMTKPVVFEPPLHPIYRPNQTPHIDKRNYSHI